MVDVALPLPPTYLSLPFRHVDELPAYTRRNARRASAHPAISHVAPSRDRAQHTYELMNSKNRPWAKLTLDSSARSSQQIPTFFEDDSIAGTVALNLDKVDSITAITVSIKGKIVTGAGSGDVYIFLNHSHPLWSKDMGNPRAPSDVRHSGKLLGSYSWPFSFKLPKKVALKPTPSAATQSYRLPQTFLEKYTTASIQYDLVVNIARTKLRPDSNLSTVFAYIPCTRPDPPSILQQLAYEDSSPLLPPETDPEGWKALPTVNIRGSVFTARNVDVKCNLFLANPLSYTRGSVIPLFLTLSSNDTQTLDLLSSGKATSVRLLRRVKYHLAGSQVSSMKQSGAELKDSTEYLDNAVWWPANDGGGDRFNKRMCGEIRLLKDLKPSSSIAHFSLEYSVVIMPFHATGFVSANRKDEPLLTVPVEISTLYARGPKPKAYAPPCYDHGRRQSVEYSSTAAYWNGSRGPF